MVLLILSNILLTSSIALSGTIDPNIPDSEYLSYARHFVYVGKLEGLYSDGSAFKASAVAIDDHHILTAAHVIHKAKYDSCILIIKDQKFSINIFRKHKQFDIEKYGSFDIALGYSKIPFNLTFYPELYSNNDEIGKVCCIAGYGATGTFDTGVKSMDNKLRAGSNVVDKFYKDLLICSASIPNSSDRTSLEFIISAGDSGGGLFIGDKLAGINSCVLTNDGSANSSYNDDTGYTRISEYLDWITKNKIRRHLDK